jgi:hypothetical protein
MKISTTKISLAAIALILSAPVAFAQGTMEGGASGTSKMGGQESGMQGEAPMNGKAPMKGQGQRMQGEPMHGRSMDGGITKGEPGSMGAGSMKKGTMTK